MRDVPVGLLIAASGVATLSGGLAAKLLHNADPTLATILTVVIGLSLYVLIRVFAHAKGNTSARAGIMVTATCPAILHYAVIVDENCIRTEQPTPSRE
jgi:hypothetical protein